MKKQNSIIFSALFFLAAILAETYSFSRFREDVVVVAGVSIVVLIAAYIFFDSLYSTYLLHLEAGKSERREQEKQFLETLDKRLEEAGRIQKALFAAAKANGRLLEEGFRSAELRDRENNERIAENLDRAARLVSRFNRDDLKRVAALERKYTDDILKALSEGSSRIAEQLSGMESLSGEKTGDSRNVAAVTECINRNFESVKIKIEGGFELMEGNLSEIRDHLVEFKTQSARDADAFKEAAAFQNSQAGAAATPINFSNPEIRSEAAGESANVAFDIPGISDLERSDDAVPDISELPDLDLPDNAVPDISELPDLDLPDDAVSDISELPDLDLPDDAVPDISELPDLDLPDDAVPDISELPDLDLPDDAVPDISELPDLDLPDDVIPDIDIPSDVIETNTGTMDMKTKKAETAPNRQMSPDEIAALFAAADESPKPAASPSPDPEKSQANALSSDDSNPNRQMSPDEIAALFAAADAGEKMPEVTRKEPEPVPTDTNEDANKQMTPEQIAALIASMGK